MSPSCHYVGAESGSLGGGDSLQLPFLGQGQITRWYLADKSDRGCEQIVHVEVIRRIRILLMLLVLGTDSILRTRRPQHICCFKSKSCLRQHCPQSYSSIT